MQTNNRIDQFKSKLTESLIEKCSSFGVLGTQLLEVEELDEKWEGIAPEYMMDSVPQFNEYPSVAIAWAGYIGMAIASMWDTDWNAYKDKKELYILLRDPRGFDEMDEYIIEEVLDLDLNSNENQIIESTWRSCAHTAMSLMRNEQIEPQSTDAFYIFAAATNVMFQLGVALELYRLGYKYEKVKIDIPNEAIS